MTGLEQRDLSRDVWITLPEPARDPSTLKANLEQFGYCLIDRALNDDRLETVQDRLFEQAAVEREQHGMKNPANTGPANQWVGMLLNKGEVFFDLIEHELFCALADHLLGPDWLVSCVDSQIQHPGAGVMPLHTDQWWMPQPVGPGCRNPQASSVQRGEGACLDPSPAGHSIAPAVAINAMWMITGFTEENGATRIVPGSHLTGQQPDASVPHKVPTVPATGPAGTAFVFDARIWHGAGANQTDASRYGITSEMVCPQFRPLENYSRGLRPEVFERCSAERLRRLGYSAWSSYGHTGDPDATVSADGANTMGELRNHQTRDDRCCRSNQV